MTLVESVSSSSSWFSELNDMWPGQCFSLEIDKLLHHKKSKYQDIKIFKTKTYGNILVLDGVIQCTEKDQCAYQEMIAHLPLFAHPSPKSVLIVGGGDGGVVREVVKHPEVEEVHLCEIDEEVIEASKQYLPYMSVGFSSPKLTIHIEDGIKYLQNCHKQFDVIITDSSDPIGPAKPLFEMLYYEKVSAALKSDGVMCCQGESIWMCLGLVRSCLNKCRMVYPVVEYACTSIPSYPCGQIGFFLCSKSKDTSFRKPARSITDKQVKELGLQYYNHKVHRAAFVLPQFAQNALSPDADELHLDR